MPHVPRFLPFLLAAATPALPAAGQNLALELVASGFSDPVYVGSPSRDYARLFVAEQKTCEIRILKEGTLLDEPFLEIQELCSQGQERGLLGVAFHPDFLANGRFFVTYTNSSTNTVIAEFATTADLDRASPVPVQTLLVVAQPNFIHNGGGMQFGPDGMLYLAMGDGGPGGDPGAKAQNGALNLGKILRLDVDKPAPFIPDDNPFVGVDEFNDEIWALGLRNPWRMSFDRLTGDLWIADVGQSNREEINFQPASSTGGENYGWRCLEGTLCTGLSGCECGDAALVAPIHEYAHTDVGCAVIGGFVYRGSAIPELSGAYFFADWCTNRIFSLRYENGAVTDLQELTEELQPSGATIGHVVTFGEDAGGELYFMDRNGGDLFRITRECSITNYCSGSANSAGESAEISAEGSTSIAANDLVLRAENAVPGEIGVFFYGYAAYQARLGDGLLCIDPAAGVARLHPPVSIDAEGATSLPLDLTALAASDLPIAPGTSMYLQLWYRDAASPTTAGFNFSDGLRVLVCP